MNGEADAFRSAVERVEKPWGYEVRFAVTERYCGKLIFVRAGEALSLQYHERKDETFYLHSGSAVIEIGDRDGPRTSVTASPGDSFRIRTRVVHRIRALEDTLFVEVSTPEIDDVVRLDDLYGRAAPEPRL